MTLLTRTTAPTARGFRRGSGVKLGAHGHHRCRHAAARVCGGSAGGEGEDLGAGTQGQLKFS